MDLNGVARRQLFLCYDMIENLIEDTPDSIWGLKKGGYIYWQQLLHAICGSLYWLRTDPDNFTEPFIELNVYPELEKDPENQLSKEQLLRLLNDAKDVASYFFDHYDSKQLLLDSVLVHAVSGLDIVFIQIRHLMYHIGHCEAILRESGSEVPEWLDVI